MSGKSRLSPEPEEAQQEHSGKGYQQESKWLRLDSKAQRSKLRLCFPLAVGATAGLDRLASPATGRSKKVGEIGAAR